MDGKVAFMDNATTLNSPLELMAVAKNHDSACNDQNIIMDFEFLVPSLRTTPTVCFKMPLPIDIETRFHHEITVRIK